MRHLLAALSAALFAAPAFAAIPRDGALGFQPAADADHEEAWSGDEEVPLRIDPNSVWGGLSLPGGQRADCLSLARVRARGVLG